MKKIAFVLVLSASILGFSAFNLNKPVKSSLDILYESSPGVFTKIPTNVTPCPQGSSDQCEVEIDGQMELLWLDAGITAYRKN